MNCFVTHHLLGQVSAMTHCVSWFSIYVYVACQRLPNNISVPLFTAGVKLVLGTQGVPNAPHTQKSHHRDAQRRRRRLAAAIASAVVILKICHRDSRGQSSGGRAQCD